MPWAAAASSEKLPASGLKIVHDPIGVRMLRNASWNAGEEMKIGRYTLRLKRSVGEGGFAFIHLVEVSDLDVMPSIPNSINTLGSTQTANSFLAPQVEYSSDFA